VRKILGLMISLCVFVSGCATYRAKALSSHNVTSFLKFQDREGLKVAAKFFYGGESRKMFGVKKVYEIYQPVYIEIDNRSTSSYGFEKGMLSREAIPAEEVAKECGFNTAARAGAYGVPGIFIWPLLIPAAYDGIGSAEANIEMRKDYMYKEIKDSSIEPGGKQNGVVFLYQMENGEELTISLRNVDTGETKAFNFIKERFR